MIDHFVIVMCNVKNTIEKHLMVFRVHVFFFGGPKSFDPLKSLRHGCQIVRHPKQRSIQQLIPLEIVHMLRSAWPLRRRIPGSNLPN